MKKRTYRSVKVQDIEIEKLVCDFDRNQPCIIGIDIAKENLYAGLGGADGVAKQIVKWKHPLETGAFLKLISDLQKRQFKIEAAMEPSGTYGEPLRYQLQRLGVAVYRIDPKRCHDLAMVLDGVASQHDPKSASLLVYMHAQGVSELWPQESEQQRQLRAQVMKRELYSDPLERHYGRLEGRLAEHWPELSYILDMRGASILALLSKYPSPELVTSDATEASKLLRRMSRRLSREKIEAVIASATDTVGVPMSAAERENMKSLIEQITQLRVKVDESNRILEQLSKQFSATKNMSDTIGLITSAVLVAFTGDPSSYACARA